MSDREFGGNDDLSLPKATVQKIINEVLASISGQDGSGSMAFAKDTRDLLIDCCVEFITMLTSEANEIAEKDAKKTIACEHITKALQELDFGEYVPELLQVADSFKVSQATREKKQSKIEQSGMTSEELIRAQEELFRSAGEKYNSTPTPISRATLADSSDKLALYNDEKTRRVLCELGLKCAHELMTALTITANTQSNKSTIHIRRHERQRVDHKFKQ